MATRRKRQATPKKMEPKKVEFKVLSGGITLANKKHYSKGDVFAAHPEEIPPAFKDILKPVEPIVPKEPVKEEPKFFIHEIVASAEEQDAEGYVQMYNVVNKKDKVISQKPLTKEEADAFLEALN